MHQKIIRHNLTLTVTVFISANIWQNHLLPGNDRLIVPLFYCNHLFVFLKKINNEWFTKLCAGPPSLSSPSLSQELAAETRRAAQASDLLLRSLGQIAVLETAAAMTGHQWRQRPPKRGAEVCESWGSLSRSADPQLSHPHVFWELFSDLSQISFCFHGGYKSYLEMMNLASDMIVNG